MRESAHKPMANQAYEFLRQKIISCEYLPGQELNEKQLLEITNFGRTPLREALLSLQKEGLVEIFPRKGMRISPFTEKQVKDLYQTRKLIEPIVIQEYRSLYSKVTLLEFQKRFQTSRDFPNMERFALDSEFHSYLISITENDILIDMYRSLMVHQIHLAMYTAIQSTDVPMDDLNQHLSIINALLRENEKDIRDAVILHINFSLIRSMSMFGSD